jgi:hypothetical protein
MIKFDLDLIENNSSIVIIGHQNSGKSHLVKDIVKHKKDIPLKVACSRKENIYHFYQGFIKDRFIYESSSSELIEKIFDRYEIIKNNNIDKRTVLILDESLSSRGDWTKDKSYLKLFNNNKNIETLLIICFNFSLGIQPEIRNTFDYVFLFNEQINHNIKRLYEHYGFYIFNNYDEFKNVFEKYTEKEYTCLVLCIKSKKYFQYKTKKNSILIII